jgi:chemotaxis family two-component system response regulator Rcp1
MPLHVLLVEDSPRDVQLTREAFREAQMSAHLHVVSDGLEAMDFLRQEGAHIHAPRPGLVLLDLGLPKMNGHEVLARIKTSDALKAIPTVVLSRSDTDSDIVKSYRLQANCYLTKPAELEAFVGLVRSIHDFWLIKAKLPQQRPKG